MEERARDRYGRPVPAGSPNEYPSAVLNGDISAEDAWNTAMHYLESGLPFHAHEVLEQRWRCCPEPERAAWRGCAQWGAALTHRARGNDIGAVRLAQRALAAIDEAVFIPQVIDVRRIRASADEIIRSGNQPPRIH